MLHSRFALIGAVGLLVACSASELPPLSTDTDTPLVKYSYTGPKMTVLTGAVPPWTTESRITGYFIVKELPPMTTTDFLDPDIHWPFPNLPETFAFTDGARKITRKNLEDVSKDTGNRLDPNKYEVRTFAVTTDSDGEIVGWDVLFVHDVRRNTFLTAHNGGIYGQDLTEVDATHFGCVATEKCTANANYTNQGPVLPDTQMPGLWTREVVQAFEGDGS
ncbi:MAG: hypothetical protein OER85_17105 [Gammaproteobacteria bacterium]|nr:hypothetical protein [Gammaproteobacteria bacterium]